MVHQFLLLSILLHIQSLCKGEKFEGPKYAIIKHKNGMDFEDSVFEKKLGLDFFGNPAWGYQSLMADNRDKNGFCGYCKFEEYKDTKICEEDYFCSISSRNPDAGVSFFLEYVSDYGHDGELYFSDISTGASGGGFGCCSSVDITPVPGTVKLMSSTPLLANYIGLYTITRQLYNGFQQYEREHGGARIYVNIYNQWVIGTQDHTDQIIMSQAEATLNFDILLPFWNNSQSVMPVWNTFIEHVNEEDSIVTLRTEAELLKSSGQPPECIFDWHQNSLFKLSADGTYKNTNSHYYNRSSYGWWALYANTDWIEKDQAGKLWRNPEEYRTSETSTVIPRLGWGIRPRYEPTIDIAIIGSPCTVTLKRNPLDLHCATLRGIGSVCLDQIPNYAGTYNIEEYLVNDHPAYAKDSELGVYVNRHQTWVLGRLTKNQSNQQIEREDILILSKSVAITPLTWSDWSNSGTQQTPVLTPIFAIL